MECAEIACASPHQLIQMIRRGATEKECMEVVNQAIRAQHRIELEYDFGIQMKRKKQKYLQKNLQNDPVIVGESNNLKEVNNVV